MGHEGPKHPRLLQVHNLRPHNDPPLSVGMWAGERVPEESERDGVCEVDPKTDWRYTKDTSWGSKVE